MSRFADFDPRPPRRSPRARPLVRPARPADLDRLAELSHRRHGGELDRHRERAGELLADESGRTLVAEVAGRVVGFARCGRLEPSPHGPPETIPRGWYLTGVVVDPEHRRRGVGHELTRVRLEWLFERSAEVFYFANECNLASAALHRAFGFSELRRGVRVPGVEFEGGAGVLYGATRPGSGAAR